MDSCVFLQGQEDVPGYQLELAEEKWLTVRWDWVDEAGDALVNRSTDWSREKDSCEPCEESEVNIR